MNRYPIPRAAALLSALLMAAALGGCNRRDDERSTGQKVDAAIAKVDEKANAAKADISRSAEEAKASTEKGMADAKKSTADAVHAAANAVNDTTITGAVKSRLSAEATLKGADLGVETHEGRVSLKGVAPDAAARDRASQVAAAVQGVVAVDNQLSVQR